MVEKDNNTNMWRLFIISIYTCQIIWIRNMKQCDDNNLIFRLSKTNCIWKWSKANECSMENFCFDTYHFINCRELFPEERGIWRHF